MRVKYIIQHRLESNRYYAGNIMLADNVWCYNPSFATRFPTEDAATIFMGIIATRIGMNGTYRIVKIETLC